MYHEVFNIEGGRRNRVVRFDSVYEFVQLKDNPSSKRVWDKEVVKRLEGGGSMNWLHAENMAQFQAILEKGDVRYTKLLIENSIEMPPPQNVKRRKLQGDYGDEVDIHKINFGSLSTAWRRRGPRTRVGAKNIRLIANTSQSSIVNVDQSKWVGVALLTIANVLEVSGYNVAIDVIMGTTGTTDQESIAFLVPAKPYEMPIDTQGLSAVVCFPGFFRGPGFMNMGLAQGELRPGLGMPLSDETAKTYIFPKYFTDDAEVVELISNTCLSKEGAEKEAARIVEKIALSV